MNKKKCIFNIYSKIMLKIHSYKNNYNTIYTRMIDIENMIYFVKGIRDSRIEYLIISKYTIIKE